MEAKLFRINSNDKQTIGNMVFIEDEKVLKVVPVLELGWHNNKRNISCIPEGKYVVKRRYSENHGHHFEITNVKNRSIILIHIGNFNFDIRGCLIVGTHFVDINKDGFIDVADSGIAMKKLKEFAPKEFELEIINAYAREEEKD